MDSSPAVDKSFSLSARGSQLKSANTNEINRAIHLAYTVLARK